MNREDLHILISESAGTRVLRLTGELDAYTSGRLLEFTKTWIDGAKRLVVNLDELEYIDSSGLSALVRIWMAVRDNGAYLAISCQNPRIYRILEITGLLNLFNIIENNPESKTSSNTPIHHHSNTPSPRTP